jgi:hypothetical protein
LALTSKCNSAETEREIKEALRKIKQPKAERAKLLRQARAKGD